MANIKSAKKRIRQTARRTETRRNRVTRIRTFVKKVEVAIQAGDKAAAEEAFRVAQPVLQRGASKGAIHRNTAARKQSRLISRIHAL